MSVTNNVIKIWTDGSCTTKLDKRGGYGVYVTYGENCEKLVRRGFIDTTTPRMEMRALLNAIQLIEKTVDTYVIVYCDSQFVVNSFRKGWLMNWKIHNFMGVKNDDLWRKINYEISIRPLMKFEINWVPGHNKNLKDPIIFGNNVADALADYKTQDTYELDIRER